MWTWLGLWIEKASTLIFFVLVKNFKVLFFSSYILLSIKMIVIFPIRKMKFLSKIKDVIPHRKLHGNMTLSEFSITQQTLTCSSLTTETLEKRMKHL